MTKVLTTCFFLLLMNYGFAQTTYDNCYRGGETAFYVLMQLNVKYPKPARDKGIEGVSILSFTVDCSNTPVDFRFENPVGYGIEEAVKSAIMKSKGSWCDCERIKKTRFEMAFLFSMSDYSSDLGKIVIKGFGGNKPIDEGALEAKVKKQIEKGKLAKAEENLAILLFKYPKNENYITLKNELTGAAK